MQPTHWLPVCFPAGPGLSGSLTMLASPSYQESNTHDSWRGFPKREKSTRSSRGGCVSPLAHPDLTSVLAELQITDPDMWCCGGGVVQDAQGRR